MCDRAYLPPFANRVSQPRKPLQPQPHRLRRADAEDLRGPVAEEEVLAVGQIAPFTQAARNLVQRLQEQTTPQEGNTPECIRQFLLQFAEHILWNSQSAAASSIPTFQDRTIKEIAALLPDMVEGQRDGLGSVPPER